MFFPSPTNSSAQGIVERLLSLSQRLPLRWAMFLLDAGVAAWLAYALNAFTTRPPLGWIPLAALGGVAGCSARQLRLHADPRGRFWPLTGQAAGYGTLVFLLTEAARFLGWIAWQHGEILWLAAANGFLALLWRTAFFALGIPEKERPREGLRWFGLGTAGTLLGGPFYFSGGVGTGDAQWYVVMLADFLTQLRAGIFPIWAGQSEFAFNGAVSPLRFAPGFQHAGGALDLLTVHALEPSAIRSAVVVAAGLAGIFSAYFCLRDILRARPGLAFLLALFYASSPGILAPLFAGDQYMTYLTTPFIPLVLNGVWRGFTQSDRTGPILTSVGLAGMWLCHAPVALWASLFAGACWLVIFIRLRNWPQAARTGGLMFAIFLLLAALPFASTASVDNRFQGQPRGEDAAREVRKYFPQNFSPIDPKGDRLAMYQIGYAALVCFGLACLWLKRPLPRGALGFLAGVIVIVPVVLPVPGLTALFWTHVPDWLVTVNNIWPQQRLLGLMAALMLFLFAMVAADARFDGHPYRASFCLLLFAGLAGWSWREFRKFDGMLRQSQIPPAIQATAMHAKNVALSRYAYASFEYPPAYLSHGYADPTLENRLLDARSLALLTANVDRAAPPIRANSASPTIPRLARTGQLQALNQNSADLYDLTPLLPLEPGRHYALRFEFLQPPYPGMLICTFGRFKREYLLPDSGQGLDHRGDPRAFGATETNSHVLSFRAIDGQPVDLHLQFLALGRALKTNFIFARYWLFTYKPQELAVVVESLMPYRARAETAGPAYVETPRMWLGGYHAAVNGRPVAVKRSPNNLAMIPIEPGKSTLTLDYAAPWWLQAIFWLCLLGWIATLTAVGALGARAFVRNASKPVSA